MSHDIRPGFFSIRLKIMLFAALALTLTAAAFTLLALRHLDERQQAAMVQHQSRSVELSARLFQQQSARLQSLGTLVADLPGVRRAMQQGDAADLARLFDPFWSGLNLTHGLDRVAFFTPEGVVLGDWGMADRSGRARELARTAGQAEAPVYWLDCSGKCLYTAAVPLVQAGSYIGVVVLAAGLEDLVMDFRRLSGAELAVIEPAVGRAGDHAGAAAMPTVGRVISVSGGVGYEEMVHSLTAGEASGDVYQARRGQRQFRLYRFDVPVSGAGRVKFLAIADITAERLEMADAVRSSIVLGMLVLVMALGLLYVSLRPTMNRLRQAMSALPMLGEGLYAEARNAFQSRNPNARYRDEVDDLAELTYALAHTLEQLQAESRDYATSLRAQATQLEQERDFVAGLLDTAPVLILTYGQDGRIRLANAHAVQVCGRESAELVGRSFIALFMSGVQQKEHTDTLARIRVGDVLHSESSFDRPDGKERDVVWFHSCLDEGTVERSYLSVGLDVTDYRQVERSLMLLAEHDSVTGLYNRRAFKRELDELLANGAHGVLVLFDIDEFKSVNEIGGHEAGDRVLVACARHIDGLDPVPMLAARLGGDDFALVFTGLSSAGAIVLARGLNQVMSYQGGLHDGAIRSRLSASVGVVVFPEHGSDADTLLANGEIALAQARTKGHGSWHLYSSDDPYHEAAGLRTHWRGEVEQALEEDRFVLHFQPILHIASGHVGHYEALLRLKGRDGKLVAPGMFIAVAESTGLIRRIDRWVIDAVVRFAAQQDPSIKVALNLSSRSFDDDVTFETMTVALQRYNVPGERLLLEITETAALANFTSATRIMALFKGLGCAFGLDDFGVGYSSFQYLKELPVDFVKIDGSFIKGLTQNQDDVVFVKALNDAVQGYGKVSIAEFVEDEATLNILREIGVDYAQGYLIGRPKPELLRDGVVSFSPLESGLVTPIYPDVINEGMTPP